MQSDYKVSRCTRRCYLQDRPLAPGEGFYSVVSENDDESLTRIDISAKAWDGPPEGTVGWWKNRMPELGERKLKPAPDALLIDLLRESEPDPLADEPSPPSFSVISADQDDDASPSTPYAEASPADEVDSSGDTNLPDELRYLLALVLLRRRALKPLDQQPAPDSKLAVEVVADGMQLQITIPKQSPSKLNRFSEPLAELLYCEAEPE